MKYRGYVPNPSAAGLAFVLPQTQYGLAMVIGATGAHFWRKRNPTHFEGCAFGASTLSVTLLIASLGRGHACWGGHWWRRPGCPPGRRRCGRGLRHRRWLPYGRLLSASLTSST